MRRPPFVKLAAFLCVGLALSGRAEIQQLASTPAPTKLRPAIVVCTTDWLGRIPPTGRVNGPDFLDNFYAGQRLTVGLIAEGAGRDELLKGVTGKVSFITHPGDTVQTFDLKPAAIRQIKAEGADMSMFVLSAGGIQGAERTKMEALMSLVSLAALAPDWTVPADQPPAEVEIRVELSGPSAVAIAPLHLPVKPVADWLKEPPPSIETIGQQITRYRGNRAPGELISWFQATARTPALRVPAVHGYYVFSFKTNAQARTAAIAAYPSLPPEVQGALLWVLRLGGADLRQLFPQLPEEIAARYDAVAALPDPRQLPEFRDPINVEAVKQLGNTMDLCWSGWMVTGDKSYLHALVSLLGHPDDFAELKTWQKNRGGEKGLNARVANGLGYQIAGWSIGSFQRTDPLVADWLAFWQNDPAVPEVVRREIGTLLTNPAFKRN